MEKPSFDLVRQILRSPNFLQQSTDQQQETLDQILRTGEITREELYRLITEEEDRNKQSGESVIPSEVKEIAISLENLDYNSFLNFIVRGQVKGKDLIALCKVSKTLNEYCNRGFQPLTGQGVPYGEVQDQYLFRLLLDKRRIRIPQGKTPKEVYREKLIGGEVWSYGAHVEGSLGRGPNFDNNSNLGQVLNLGNNIIQVSVGGAHSLCLDTNGKVMSFGLNNKGQLGLGHQETRDVPVMIENLPEIIQVSAGNGHSLCLDINGRVWSFGSNEFGQLGLGQSPNISIPTLIPNFRNIVKVSTGYFHSLCLDDQGKVWCFGRNGDGQLGLGDLINRTAPTLNPNLKDIIQVAGGRHHSLCLDNQGLVWGFGRNNGSQLGLEKFTDNETLPQRSQSLRNIVEISCGESHSLALNNEGQVWVFGTNAHGELGLGSFQVRQRPVLNYNLKNITQISAGGTNSVFINQEEKVILAGAGLEKTIFLNLDHVISASYGIVHLLCIRRPQ